LQDNRRRRRRKRKEKLDGSNTTSRRGKRMRMVMEIMVVNITKMIMMIQEMETNILKNAGAHWLKHYVTSREVASSIPDEVNEFFSIYLILLSALSPGDFSAPKK
jgi:hypothetical protein